LECGTVHVNSYGEDGNQIPFGGIKDSGQGKEKSIDTLTSYFTTKSICIKLAARA
jgi:acyl-CoA reductase-like NAD-dependent aldehyde dehydrogenase